METLTSTVAEEKPKNNTKIAFVVMHSGGYWGKGKTLQEAATNCMGNPKQKVGAFAFPYLTEKGYEAIAISDWGGTRYYWEEGSPVLMFVMSSINLEQLRKAES